ncbi:hypothetical protein THZG08_580013 [Vibrio owensii]|nr:hypothetical protein THZG08_580013 [Vibrio owensii]CAH1586472.1 hypothetical protein THOA03_580013 [Vibrio owensii]
MLFGILLDYVCSECEIVDDFYMMVRGANFLSLVESFGGVVISSNREVNVVGNIYLVKFNLLKTLSNSFVFSLFRKSYGTYHEIVENK